MRPPAIGMVVVYVLSIAAMEDVGLRMFFERAPDC